MTNPRTGKVERVFVDLESVYPNAEDPLEEMSFEELRAQSRGWLDKDWTAANKNISNSKPVSIEELRQVPLSASDSVPEGVQDLPLEHAQFASQDTETQSEIIVEARAREAKVGRPKKMKIMEVKGETQTSRLFVL